MRLAWSMRAKGLTTTREDRMKHVGSALAVGLLVFAGAAHAEIANGKVKIGVLTDLVRRL